MHEHLRNNLQTLSVALTAWLETPRLASRSAAQAEALGAAGSGPGNATTALVT